jgi:hypothetical protein
MASEPGAPFGLLEIEPFPLWPIPLPFSPSGPLAFQAFDAGQAISFAATGKAISQQPEPRQFRVPATRGRMAADTNYPQGIAPLTSTDVFRAGGKSDLYPLFERMLDWDNPLNDWSALVLAGKQN